LPRGGNSRYKMHIVKSLTELFNRHVGFACGVCQCLGPPASRQVALQKCEKEAQRGAGTWGLVQSWGTAQHAACVDEVHAGKKQNVRVYALLHAGCKPRQWVCASTHALNSKGVLARA